MTTPTFRGFARALGRTLIALGVLLILFVAYQLWGTGLRSAQAQDRLKDDFRRALSDVNRAPLAASPDPTTPIPETTAAPPITAAPYTSDRLPAEGEVAGRIEIPAIGLDWRFVQGVSAEDLKKGPGHYPDTPMPGQAGNSAIAGHRTTYGAPFNRINELQPGDDIIVTTLQGQFQYRMTEQLIVAPTQVDILLPIAGKNVLTLTSCHPKYSARQRIIVRGELSSSPLSTVLPILADDAARGVDTTSDSTASAPLAIGEASLSGARVGRWPAVLYGALAAIVWAATWAVGQRWRRAPAYAFGLAPFLIVLFFFFENVSRLLPANY